MEYAIIAPDHLSVYRSAGSFVHLLDDQSHEDSNGKRVVSSDSDSTTLVLPYKLYDAEETFKQADGLLNSDLIESEEVCIRLEGSVLAEQIALLAMIDSDERFDSILLPPYNNVKDRESLLKITDRVKVRILEVPVRCEEQITLFKEHNVVSISTSLPVRLGCLLRDIGEGPEPDFRLKDLEDMQPRWTKRVVKKFVKLCQ